MITNDLCRPIRDRDVVDRHGVLVVSDCSVCSDCSRNYQSVSTKWRSSNVFSNWRLELNWDIQKAHHEWRSQKYGTVDTGKVNFSSPFSSQFFQSEGKGLGKPFSGWLGNFLIATYYVVAKIGFRKSKNVTNLFRTQVSCRPFNAQTWVAGKSMGMIPLATCNKHPNFAHHCLDFILCRDLFQPVVILVWRGARIVFGGPLLAYLCSKHPSCNTISTPSPQSYNYTVRPETLYSALRIVSYYALRLPLFLGKTPLVTYEP